MLKVTNWEFIVEKDLHSTDEQWKSFQKYLVSVIDTCFPAKKVLVKANDPPWMNAEVNYHLSRRDSAYALKRICPTGPTVCRFYKD